LRYRYELPPPPIADSRAATYDAGCRHYAIMTAAAGFEYWLAATIDEP